MRLDASREGVDPGETWYNIICIHVCAHTYEASEGILSATKQRLFASCVLFCPQHTNKHLQE